MSIYRCWMMSTRSQLLNSVKVYNPPTPPAYERLVSHLLILAVRRGSSGSRTPLDHSSGLAGQSQAEACPCRFCALLRCESSCLISKTRLHNKQLLLHSIPRLFCPHDVHLLSTHRLPHLFRPHNRKLSTPRVPYFSPRSFNSPPVLQSPVSTRFPHTYRPSNFPSAVTAEQSESSSSTKKRPNSLTIPSQRLQKVHPTSSQSPLTVHEPVDNVPVIPDQQTMPMDAKGSGDSNESVDEDNAKEVIKALLSTLGLLPDDFNQAGRPCHVGVCSLSKGGYVILSPCSWLDKNI
jgi:hypothetical protein